jgi:hypothetical protein
VISLKLLSALNAADDDLIEHVATAIEDGTIAAECDGDLITSLALTKDGLARLPLFLPTGAA